MWEQSAPLDPSFAIVHRNLAVAYSHRGDPPAKAIAQLEKAVSLDRKYPIHFTELDELYESAATAPEKRLALLEKNHAVVAARDDSQAREIAMKVVAGKYDEAIQLMTGRQFAVWEGANLNVAEDWSNAHLLRGRQRLAARQYREALADFQAAGTIPDNLPGEGRGVGGHEAEVAYWTGAAYEGLGDAAQAKASWSRASTAGAGGGRGRQVSAEPYWRALALRKLGQESAAQKLLEAMVQPGQPAFTMGLGYLGLGQAEQARTALHRALEANPAHVGARAALASMTR